MGAAAEDAGDEQGDQQADDQDRRRPEHPSLPQPAGVSSLAEVRDSPVRRLLPTPARHCPRVAPGEVRLPERGVDLDGAHHARR
jgi:hypothetical protein